MTGHSLINYSIDILARGKGKQYFLIIFIKQLSPMYNVYGSTFGLYVSYNFLMVAYLGGGSCRRAPPSPPYL